MYIPHPSLYFYQFESNVLWGRVQSLPIFIWNCLINYFVLKFQKNDTLGSSSFALNGSCINCIFVEISRGSYWRNIFQKCPCCFKFTNNVIEIRCKSFTVMNGLSRIIFHLNIHNLISASNVYYLPLTHFWTFWVEEMKEQFYFHNQKLQCSSTGYICG